MIEFTNNIPFLEASKIVQTSNLFPTKSYTETSKSNTSKSHENDFKSCHIFQEKLTQDNLPKFINDLKSSPSESEETTSSTFTKSIGGGGAAIQVTPQVNETSKLERLKDPLVR